MEAIMGKLKYVFIAIYVLSVIGSVQNYEKQFGGEVFSPLGIIDNFVFNLLPAAIWTGVIFLVYKLFLKVFKKNKGTKPTQDGGN
jgi:lipoprotein signal peptidase